MVAVYNHIKITEHIETKLVIKAISFAHTCNVLANKYPNGKSSIQTPKFVQIVERIEYLLQP